MRTDHVLVAAVLHDFTYGLPSTVDGVNVLRLWQYSVSMFSEAILTVSLSQAAKPHRSASCKEALCGGLVETDQGFCGKDRLETSQKG